jgi:hypothetical protein
MGHCDFTRSGECGMESLLARVAELEWRLAQMQYRMDEADRHAVLSEMDRGHASVPNPSLNGAASLRAESGIPPTCAFTSDWHR